MPICRNKTLFPMCSTKNVQLIDVFTNQLIEKYDYFVVKGGHFKANTLLQFTQFK